MLELFSKVCNFFGVIALNIARIALAALGLVVLYGVIFRYFFNDAPPYTEQLALLLVLTVSMLGAAFGAREGGHIGLDSVIKLLPLSVRKAVASLVDILTMVFAAVLFVCGSQMALSTQHDSIPTLDISEAWRYAPLILAALLIFMFAVEHIAQTWTSASSAHAADSDD